MIYSFLNHFCYSYIFIDDILDASKLLMFYKLSINLWNIIFLFFSFFKESKNTNKSLRLLGILMKLHLLSIIILVSISYILGLKTVIKEKYSIITNIIEYLKDT